MTRACGLVELERGHDLQFLLLREIAEQGDEVHELGGVA